MAVGQRLLTIYVPRVSPLKKTDIKPGNKAEESAQLILRTQSIIQVIIFSVPPERCSTSTTPDVERSPLSAKDALGMWGLKKKVFFPPSKFF